MARVKRPSFELGPLQRLHLFRTRVEELRELEYVKAGTPFAFDISPDAPGEEPKYHQCQPSEEVLRSFLLAFRRFVSSSEYVFVGRIFNDCLRFLKDDLLRAEVGNAKEEWKRRIRSGPVRLRVGGHDITPEETLDLLVNGYYFHDDPAKALRLAQLALEPIDLARLQLVSSLPGLTAVILKTGSLVGDALDRGLFAVPSDEV